MQHYTEVYTKPKQCLQCDFTKSCCGIDSDGLCYLKESIKRVEQHDKNNFT